MCGEYNLIFFFLCIQSEIREEVVYIAWLSFMCQEFIFELTGFRFVFLDLVVGSVDLGCCIFKAPSCHASGPVAATQWRLLSGVLAGDRCCTHIPICPVFDEVRTGIKATAD